MVLECLLLTTSLCHALKDRPVLALGSLQVVSMAGDGLTTLRLVHRVPQGQELAPWSRPLIGARPTVSRMAAVGAVVVVGQMWLAERLKTSRHRWLRRVWWVPLGVGIVANSLGVIHNLSVKK